MKALFCDNRKFTIAVIAAALLLYLVLALGSSMTRRPWSDEGWFAAAAYNLAFNGSPGTPVLEPVEWLAGIERHTYWVMPLHLVAQAAWYRAFGFSLFSLRMLSSCCGLIALAAWALIVLRLTGDARAAVLTLVLLAFDYVFVTGASFGRMDLMCSALGAAGLAAYLWLRERHLSRAVLAGHTLVVCSGLTHFNGVLWLIGLLLLTFYFDRQQLRLKHPALAAIPYLIGAAAWGSYILQDPVSFWHQFTGNAANSNRLSALGAPWRGLSSEIVVRYGTGFGLGEHSPGHSGLVKFKALILAAYVAGVIGAVCVRSVRVRRGVRVLLLLLSLWFITMSLLDGQKLQWYLIHVIPLYAALLAVAVSHCLERQTLSRWLVAAGLIALITLQAGGTLHRIRLNESEQGYGQAARFLKAHAGPQALVMGGTELGFELGFTDRLRDDPHLGYDTGRQPDFIVVEEIYEDAFRGLQKERPEIYRHVTHCLTQTHREVFRCGTYRIYARSELKELF